MIDELHRAAGAQNGYDRVRHLIEVKKIDVNSRHSKFGTRPVDFAAQSGSLETLRYLIEVAHADLDALEEKEGNLLRWGRENTPDVIEYITDPQNKIIEEFNDGTTYLHAAVQTGNVNRVNALLTENPECIFEINMHGQSALYLAAATGNQACLSVLMTHDAFLKCQEPDKNDPIFTGSALWFAILGNKSNSLDDALNAYKKSVRCAEQITVKDDDSYCLLSKGFIDIGTILFQKRDLAGALEAFNKAHGFCTKLNNRHPKKLELQRYAEKSIEAIEKKQKLEKEAEAWGFECHDVPGDGNCFFHAVFDQLKRSGANLPDWSTGYFRRLTADHICKNIEHYLAFLLEDELNILISEIRTDNTWMDEIAITAFARAFNCSVVILKSNGNPTIIRRPDPVNTLYLGHEVGHHYQSLRVIPGLTPTKIIAEIIKSTDIDAFQEPEDVATEFQEFDDVSSPPKASRVYRKSALVFFSSDEECDSSGFDDASVFHP